MFEVLVLDDQGREILSAHTVVIRDKQNRTPLAFARSKGDGVIFMTADNPQFNESLKKLVFPADLRAEGIRLPTSIKRV